MKLFFGIYRISRYFQMESQRHVISDRVKIAKVVNVDDVWTLLCRVENYAILNLLNLYKMHNKRLYNILSNAMEQLPLGSRITRSRNYAITGWPRVDVAQFDGGYMNAVLARADHPQFNLLWAAINFVLNYYVSKFILFQHFVKTEFECCDILLPIMVVFTDVKLF